jgi:hypothetical protein
MHQRRVLTRETDSSVCSSRVIDEEFPAVVHSHSCNDSLIFPAFLDNITINTDLAEIFQESLFFLLADEIIHLFMYPFPSGSGVTCSMNNFITHPYEVKSGGKHLQGRKSLMKKEVV